MIREILSPLQSGTIEVTNVEFTRQLERELIYAREVMEKMAKQLDIAKHTATTLTYERSVEALSAYEQFKKDTEV